MDNNIIYYDCYIIGLCSITPVPIVENAGYKNLGGSMVKYRCDPDYEFEDPSKAVVTCSGGTWSELPVCSK